MDDSAPKPERFEEEQAEIDESEDPNEFLLGPASDKSIMWMVKVPRSLMETWRNVQQDGVHLGTVKVVTKKRPDGSDENTVSLILPDQPAYDTKDEGPEFSLDITGLGVEGAYVLQDQPKQTGTNKRARTTSIVGDIMSMGSLRPTMNDAYERKLKRRVIEANKPKRTVIRELDLTTERKMAAGGAAFTNAGFEISSLDKKPSARGRPEPFERAARVARNELLDMLFDIFGKEAPFWSMKDLRKRTQQPETYLKEVLSNIAILHRHGPNTGTWSLKPEFASNASSSQVTVAGSSTAGAGPSGSQEMGEFQEGAIKDESDSDSDSDSDDEMDQVA